MSIIREKWSYGRKLWDEGVPLLYDIACSLLGWVLYYTGSITGCVPEFIAFHVRVTLHHLYLERLERASRLPWGKCATCARIRPSLDVLSYPHVLGSWLLNTFFVGLERCLLLSHKRCALYAMPWTLKVHAMSCALLYACLLFIIITIHYSPTGRCNRLCTHLKACLLMNGRSRPLLPT